MHNRYIFTLPLRPNFCRINILSTYFLFNTIITKNTNIEILVKTRKISYVHECEIENIFCDTCIYDKNPYILNVICLCRKRTVFWIKKKTTNFKTTSIHKFQIFRNLEINITISLNDVVNIAYPLHIVSCIFFTHSHNFLNIRFSNMFD